MLIPSDVHVRCMLACQCVLECAPDRNYSFNHKCFKDLSVKLMLL